MASPIEVGGAGGGLQRSIRRLLTIRLLGARGAGVCHARYTRCNWTVAAGPDVSADTCAIYHFPSSKQ
jgi:hypothetical protein